MAGANKILKAGQVVFKAGDAADGMYLVRKGELVVYLEQDGKEVVLAKIGEGGMIGEMALFDRQPRSASVKASAECEVTLISLDDFGKLMKQIPKWFVGLMSALSSRLRVTNDRLKQVESSLKDGGASSGVSSSPPGSSKPYQNLLRSVHLLELLWHRDGTKEGKDWCLQRKIAEESLISVFGEPAERVKALIDFLTGEQIISLKNDQYKNVVLAMANRGALRQFAEFVTDFLKANPSVRAISPATMTVLKVLQKLGANAPYDQYTCSLEDIVDEAKMMGLDTAGVETAVKNFVTYGDAVKPVKATSKSALGLRVVKADFPAMLKNINIFNKLSISKLDH